MAFDKLFRHIQYLGINCRKKIEFINIILNFCLIKCQCETPLIN